MYDLPRPRSLSERPSYIFPPLIHEHAISEAANGRWDTNGLYVDLGTGLAEVLTGPTHPLPLECHVVELYMNEYSSVSKLQDSNWVYWC